MIRRNKMMELLISSLLLTDEQEFDINTNNVLDDTEWARAYGLTFLAPRDNGKEVLSELLTSAYISVKNFFIQFLP